MLIQFGNIQSQYDVVVIGAGIAGSHLLNKLSDDLSILLIDYRDSAKNKPCSGILVGKSIELLHDYEMPESVLEVPGRIDITYIDLRTKLRNDTHRCFINTDRNRLDRFILGNASRRKNNNVSFRTKLVDSVFSPNEQMHALTISSGGRRKVVHCHYMVGCDGAGSMVRRNVSHIQPPYYIAIHQESRMDHKLKRAYFLYDRTVTDFYMWVIPKRGMADIGATIDPQCNIRETFGKVKSIANEYFRIHGDGKVSSAKVLRPRSLDDVCLGKGNTLICGEAAGLISPSSAEGISYALESASYCAMAINKGTDALIRYVKYCRPLLNRLKKKFHKVQLMNSKEGIRKIYD